MRKKCSFSSIILMVLLLVVCGRSYATTQGDFVDYPFFTQNDNHVTGNEYPDGIDEIQTATLNPKTAIFATSYLSNGLVAYYPFNGNANDASGHGNNGTVYGATLTKDRFGKQNSAYKFDGTYDYILVPDRASLRLKTFTIVAWVNPDYFFGGNRIVEKGNSNSYWLDINPNNNTVIGFYDGAYYDLISKNTIALNKWSFIVGTYDGALLKIYINGTLNNSRSISSQLYQSAQPLVIGWKYNGITADHYSGLMDDIRIYNRALSAKEIQLLADRPSDHKVAGKNIGWCYPLQDLCNDKMICKTPVQNVTFGFMSYNKSSYPGLRDVRSRQKHKKRVCQSSANSHRNFG